MLNVRWVFFCELLLRNYEGKNLKKKKEQMSKNPLKKNSLKIKRNNKKEEAEVIKLEFSIFLR